MKSEPLPGPPQGNTNAVKTDGRKFAGAAVAAKFLCERRSNDSLAGPLSLTYMCSSVDILPFLYSLALGNEYWRTNENDMVYYLRQRESILDAIYKNNGTITTLPQRRISNIPLLHPSIGPDRPETNQPFIVHTADDYSVADLDGTYQPSHIVAFRTVDQTDINTSSSPFTPANSFGGGKLVAYSFWDTCDAITPPNMGLSTGQQYEFYNYSTVPANGSLPPNPQEVGNQYLDPTTGDVEGEAQDYYNNFFNFMAGMNGINPMNELYQLNTDAGAGSNTQQVMAAIPIAYNNYRTYLLSNNNLGLTGSTGFPVSNTSCS